MGLREIIAADIAKEILPEVNDTATIDAVTGRRCLAELGGTETILSTDGNPIDRTARFLILTADFTTLPRSGSKVLYPEDGPKTYRVVHVRHIQGVAAWLECVDWKSK